MSKTEQYLFENHKLSIIDPELELKIRDTTISQPEKKELFYPTGELHCERFFVQREDLTTYLHGPSTYYSSDGNILSKSWLVEGVRQGKSWHYDSKGNLISLLRFKDGYPHNKQEYFYQDHLHKSIMNYKEGTLHGMTLLFYPNGQVKRQIPYVNGKKNGLEKVFDERANLRKEAAFDHDQLKRETFWSVNNCKIEEKIIHFPKRHSDYKKWSVEGKPLLAKVFTSNDYIYEEWDTDEKTTKHYSGTLEGGIEWIDQYFIGTVTEEEAERMRNLPHKKGNIIEDSAH